MINNNLSKWATALAGATFNLTVLGLCASAQVLPPGSVLPPNSTFAGKTQYEWSADWWTTFLEAPSVGNPLVSSDSDSAELEAINNPSSPVFFLTGSLDPLIQPINRTVTILGNQAIFFPVYNAFNADPSIPPSKLCSNISSVAPVEGNNLSATLDGVPIPIGGNLNPWRQNCGDQPDSGGFVVNELPGSLLQALAGDSLTLPYNFVSDGYWLLLTPLTPGEHTITFDAEQNNTSLQNNTYHITVVTVPESSSIFSLVSLGTLGAVLALKRKTRGNN